MIGTIKGKTLYDWKSAITIIVGLFVAGVFSVISITTYLDDQASEKFFSQAQGQVLQQKSHMLDEILQEQNKKINDIREQQTVILIEISKINSKLDLMSHKNKN